MIQKNNITWNEDYKHNNFLYFIQRITEMLDYTTEDVFRAPLYNTPRLVDEYIRIDNGFTKDYQLEEVFKELSEFIERDVILNYKWGTDKIKQIKHKLNENPKKRREVILFLRSALSQYLFWAEDYIKSIITKNPRDTNKIERAICCYLPELLRAGYSRDEIYHYTKNLVNDSIDPVESISCYFSRFDLRKRKYDVYLGISKKLLAFKAILSQRLDVIFDTDQYFSKLTLSDEFTVVKMGDIETIDASEAAYFAFKHLELFTSYYQFLGDYSENLVNNKVLVVMEDGETRNIVTDRNKFKSVSDDKKVDIGIISTSAIDNVMIKARRSMSELNKLINLHNRAIAGNGLENGFLNLWSIMEIVCASKEDGFKIDYCKDVAVPILTHDYLYGMFLDITKDIINVLEREKCDEFFKEIDGYEEDIEKVVAMILLPKYKDTFTRLCDELVNYPVLYLRITKLNECVKKRDLNKVILNYQKFITYQLYRFYRIRNQITHAGQKIVDLKDYCELLHSYVDCLIKEIINKLCNSDLREIQNVLIDSSLIQETYFKHFDSDEPICDETIKLILSNSSIWINCD